MDPNRARALLDQERARLQDLEGSVRRDRRDERSPDPPHWSDGAAPEVAQETDEAISELVRTRREALTRAEDRLAAGTFGRSVRSGAMIPDERLEVEPLAELTVEEAAADEGVR
jgi:DnaK suppressor protein